MTVQRSKLGKDQVGLLKVVPADLLVLHGPVRGDPFDPVGEGLVELGARSFEQALVGRIADKDMQEPIRLLPGELGCLVLPDELLL